jgi:hypothetical protein
MKFCRRTGWRRCFLPLHAPIEVSRNFVETTQYKIVREIGALYLRVGLLFVHGHAPTDVY